MFEHTRVVGARAIGPAHARDGKGCDDAFAWRQYGDAVQLLAVADGAGSVSGTSAWGSWAATQFVTHDDVARGLVTDLLRASTRDDAGRSLRLLFLGALRHVAYHASRLRIPLHLTNTTLAVAVLTPLRTWIAEIGDGIIAVADGTDARTLLMESKGDGPASDTYFLQLLGHAPEHEAFRFDVLDGLGAIALSTDGMRYQATQVQHGYAAYPGFFETWWRNADKGMNSDEMRREIEAFPLDRDVPLDDKTLVVGIRSPSPSNADWYQDLLNCSDSSSACSPMPEPPSDTDLAANSGSRRGLSEASPNDSEDSADAVRTELVQSSPGRRFVGMESRVHVDPDFSPEVDHHSAPDEKKDSSTPPTREPD